MRKPKYRRHTTRDRAFVELNGKRRYLPGKYKSPESLSAYRDIIIDLARYDEAPERKPVIVAEVAEHFISWARSTYPPGARSESSNCAAAIGHLVQADGATAIAAYGPLRLKALQQKLAKAKAARNYINSVCARVKRMFKWAVSEELIEPSIYHALATVPGLRKGRTLAKETKQKLPAGWDVVAPVLPELSPTVQNMVMLQWYTGVRSQSICQARAGQFDCTKDPWEWRPRHKTEHLDYQLLIFIGRKAQAILVPLLIGKKPGEYLFQPKHAKTGRRARGYRSFYDSVSYLRAVKRAIDRVNEPLQPNEQIQHWTPHQLRHARATLVRAAHGLEAAQASLGHARIDATQIYAQKQIDLARMVAQQMG